MQVRRGSYIEGSWRPSSGDAMFPVVNPYTEEPFGEATIATAQDVDAAVTAAHRALAGEWRQTSLDDRVGMVKLVREQLLARASELAAVAVATWRVRAARMRQWASICDINGTYPISSFGRRAA